MGLVGAMLQMLMVLFVVCKRKRMVLGIFSREDRSTYRFLFQIFTSQILYREVRTFTIRNNGWRDFLHEVSLCDCAILYHSKNRGRVNITDVTDSLYDEELTCLSTNLGRRNVLVVVDELDSSTEEDKQRILQGQPLIQTMARDLILFSRDMSETRRVRKLQEIQLELMCRGLLETFWVPEKVASAWIAFIKGFIFQRGKQE